MLLRLRPSGFIEPCLPSPAERPPSGPNWIHEIKHDGFRVRLFTRNGNDWTPRYPLICEAVSRLKVRSCLIDGEAVCCDEDGVPTFQKLRLRRDDRHVFLSAFDLLQPAVKREAEEDWGKERWR
jgi:ATP-dependent DNA ligase